MTVNVETSRISYNGSGSTGPFSIPFYFINEDDLKVVKTLIADGTEEVLTLTTDYTLTGEGDEDGGALTLVSALASTHRLTIILDPDRLQETEYPRGDTFPSATTERTFDYVTNLVKRAHDLASRAFRLPDGVASAIETAINITGKAGYYLRLNAAGTGFELAVGDPSTSTFTQSGTGAVSRSLTSKLGEIISVTDFNPAKDGSSDDYTAFVNALAAAAGRTLFIPNGTYRIDLSTAGRTLTPPADCRILFESRSAILDIVATGMTAETRTLLTCASSNVLVVGGKINVSNVADASSTIIFYGLGTGERWRISGQEWDGNVAYSGSLNWSVMGVKILGDLTDFVMENCYAHHLNRVYLRDNSATHTVRSLKWLHNRFESMFRAPIALNSPNGTTSDVLIQGNTSKDNDARTTGGADHLHFGLGSCKRVRCVDNDISGTGDGIHIEESAEEIIVSGNSMNLSDAAAYGIRLVDNNINGGSYISPQKVTIVGNTIKGPGTGTSTGWGIYTVDDASGQGPVDNLTITGNVIEGFSIGIRLDDDITSLLVTANIIKSCTTGVQSPTGAFPSVFGNCIESCTNGLLSTDAASEWGMNFYNGVTNVINANSFNYQAPLNRFAYTDHYELFDDFMGDLIADEWTTFTGSDGACSVAVLPTGGAGGRLRLTTGAGAGASMAVNGVQANGALQTRADSGDVSVEWRFTISTITSVCVFVGLTDQIGALEMPFTLAAGNALTSNATDAVGFLFDTNADTDNFWLVGVANNVDATKQDAGLAPNAGTMVTLRVDLSTSGAATFYRNGAQVGTAMTGAVTATTLLCPVICAFARTNASRNIDADYVLLRGRRGAA